MVTPTGLWVNESADKSLPLGVRPFGRAASACLRAGGRLGHRDSVEVPRMTEIIINEGDRIEWAIKAFRRKGQRSNVLKDARKKRHYVKPSLAKRLKRQAALARKRKRSRE